MSSICTSGNFTIVRTFLQSCRWKIYETFHNTWWYSSIATFSYGSRYSRMDQVKFVEESLQKIWSDMVCYGLSAQADHIILNFLKAVFHKFYLVYSWIPWPTYLTILSIAMSGWKLLNQLVENICLLTWRLGSVCGTLHMELMCKSIFYLIYIVNGFMHNIEKIPKHTLKILWCEHDKVFKICLGNFCMKRLCIKRLTSLSSTPQGLFLVLKTG